MGNELRLVRRNAGSLASMGCSLASLSPVLPMGSPKTNRPLLADVQKNASNGSAADISDRLSDGTPCEKMRGVNEGERGSTGEEQREALGGREALSRSSRFHSLWPGLSHRKPLFNVHFVGVI